MPEQATRLDVELVRRGLARSRGHARDLVLAGRVEVRGRAVRRHVRASTAVCGDTDIRLVGDDPPRVGRGGTKLDAALAAFAPLGLTVAGRRCLDVGAGTGGFTEALLAAGAVHVVALDVGRGQLARTLTEDPRVTDLSGTSIRGLGVAALGEVFAVVVVDVSFISVRLLVADLRAQLEATGDLVVLVKPQFEVGRNRLGKSGVVRAGRHRREAVQDVATALADGGLTPVGLVASPIRGSDGNQEYLLWCTARPDTPALDVSAVLTDLEGG